MVADDHHEAASINTLLIAAIVAATILFAYVVKRHHCHYLTESAASVMIGALVGGVARLVHPGDRELSSLRFDNNLFFFLLLPPIIFEAGYSLKRKRFFRNLTTIMLYAVIGTLISTFIVGLGLFQLARHGWVSGIDSKDPLQALLFGALISAVDPVATLSIMGRPSLNCDPLLYSLVFGESVLNDAVSIVLFKTFASLASETHELDEPLTYLKLVGEFLYVSLGSVAIGVLIGLVATALCRHTHLRTYPEKEIAVLLVFAYIAYAAGEATHLSGIMSLFFCGVVLAHYNWYNLSQRSQETSYYVFKAFAMASESLVFAYLGMSIFSGEYPLSSWNVKFIVCAFLLCLAARAVNIFPLSAMANCRRKRRISWKMQIVMWFAGLRGAIAFALALSMPEKDDNHVWDNDVVVTTTLTIVVFTTVVCGGLTSPLLNVTGMRRDVVAPQEAGGSVDTNSTRQRATTDSMLRPEPRSGLHKKWKAFDNKVMKPCFRLGTLPPEDVVVEDEYDEYATGAGYVPDGVADAIVESGGDPALLATVHPSVALSLAPVGRSRAVSAGSALLARGAGGVADGSPAGRLGAGVGYGATTLSMDGGVSDTDLRGPGAPLLPQPNSHS